MSGMNKLFLTIDIIAVVVLLAIEAIVLIRWLKKRKNAEA